MGKEGYLDVGRKDDEGKSRVELIPPKVLLGVGEVLGYGAEKYGADNWRKVADGKRRYYAAALRHLLQWKSGEGIDKESGLLHLDHALTCLMFLRELDEVKAGEVHSVGLWTTETTNGEVSTQESRETTMGGVFSQEKLKSVEERWPSWKRGRDESGDGIKRLEISK